MEVSEYNPGLQNLAIGEDHLFDTADRQAVLDGLHSDSDLISRFERLLAPAQVDHVGWITGLGSPMRDVALVILHIEPQKAVWIGPKPFRDDSFQGQLFRRVVGRRAVVREQRNANREHAEKNRDQFPSHRIPPRLFWRTPDRKRAKANPSRCDDGGAAPLPHGAAFRDGPRAETVRTRISAWTSISRIIRFSCLGHNEFAAGAGSNGYSIFAQPTPKEHTDLNARQIELSRKSYVQIRGFRIL
jgi:hypothetical protein